MPRAAAAFLVAAGFLVSTQTARAENPVVRFTTTEGSFDVELCGELSTLCSGVAPGTVTNFLNYVDRDAYQNSLIHRNAVPPKYPARFVIQGGGFFLDSDDIIRAIPTDPAITNTFNQSNKRGTIAMARGGVVDSATSQWFVNLSDNAGVPPNGLDFQNGGFTVFGIVSGDGMLVVDAIADLGYRNFYTVNGLPSAFFNPIFDPSSIKANFAETPMQSGFVPVTVPQDAIPYFVTMNITRVPEAGAALASAVALGTLAVLTRRRA